MDTIAYRAPASDPTNMQLVVTEYSKFALSDVVASSKSLCGKYDLYDNNNDVSATNWLLDSIDADLKKDLQDRLKLLDGFTPHWIQLISLIQSVSFARFDRIKREIETISILKYPQQNVKDMATDFLSKGKELSTHGHYEHRLTLTMLNKFLEGGGSSGDHYTLQYRHSLLELRSKLDKTLVEIGRLSTTDQNLRIASENLTYRDICQRAEEEWKKLFDDGRWGPARVKQDSHRPPTNFGANLFQAGPGAVDPQVILAALGLIQSNGLQLKGTGGSTKPGKCRNCGKEGHWAKECPDKQSKKDTNGTNQPNTWRKRKPDASWCTKVEEKNGVTHWSYKHNDKVFHYCNTCKRWTTSHWTGTHKPRAELGSASGNGNNQSSGSYLAAVTGGIPFETQGLFHFNFHPSPSPTCNVPAVNPWHQLLLIHLFLFVGTSWLVGGCFGLAPALWFILGYVSCLGPTLFFEDGCRWSRAARKAMSKAWYRARRRSAILGSSRGRRCRSSPPRRSPREGGTCPPFHGHRSRSHAEQTMFSSTPWPLRNKPRRPNHRRRRSRSKSRCPPCPQCGKRWCTGCRPWMARRQTPDHHPSMFSFQSLGTLLGHPAVKLPFSLFSGAHQEATFPIIWDSGASVCLTFDQSDFEGPMASPPANQRTTGCVGSDIPIEGMGTVAWSVTDTTSSLRTLKVRMLVIPFQTIRDTKFDLLKL